MQYVGKKKDTQIEGLIKCDTAKAEMLCNRDMTYIMICAVTNTCRKHGSYQK